jgi:hypothetical protein
MTARRGRRTWLKTAAGASMTARTRLLVSSVAWEGGR